MLCTKFYSNQSKSIRIIQTSSRWNHVKSKISKFCGLPRFQTSSGWSATASYQWNPTKPCMPNMSPSKWGGFSVQWFPGMNHFQQSLRDAQCARTSNDQYLWIIGDSTTPKIIWQVYHDQFRGWSESSQINWEIHLPWCSQKYLPGILRGSVERNLPSITPVYHPVNCRISYRSACSNSTKPLIFRFDVVHHAVGQVLPKTALAKRFRQQQLYLTISGRQSLSNHVHLGDNFMS